jgi:hypothetical protein
MNRRWSSLAVALLCVVAGSGWLWFKVVGAGADMTASAEKFLGSLSAEQKTAAVLKYDDPARLDWHFIPKEKRKGLQIKEMNDQQQKLAHQLLSAALSEAGYKKATTIMSLEAILRELEKERASGPIRDPQRYYFTLFGKPGLEGKWGLSVEGHHLSLNFSVEDGRLVSTTPSFFGANPATVKSNVGVGPKEGTRVLKDEEQLAFDLVNSLDEAQLKVAMLSDMAPKDIRGPADQQPPKGLPEGLAAEKFTDAQQKTLWSLLEAYANCMPKEIAQQRLSAIKEAGVREIRFAWAGARKPGIGHYYRVQGPTFLIEFVNTQPDSAGNPANHIHSVWRDMAGDFAVARK